MEQQNSVDKLTSASSVEASEPIFTRKKTLLTVGQYAARQGVSAGIVQECTKLGTVQVRKHKDKTFIVDLPLDTYKILKQQDSPSETIDSTLCANKITELVNRIFKPDSDIKGLPTTNKTIEAGEDSSDTKPVSSDLSASPAQLENLQAIPDLQLFAEKETKVINDKNNIELPDSGFRVPPMRNVTDTIRSVSIWKMSFAFAAVAFALSFIAYTTLSIERKNQQQKLQQAYDSIDKLMTKYEQTRQQARVAEFDMLTWQSEAEQAKKALLNTENELQNTRQSLFETKKDLQNTQQYNNEKLKELNEQVTKIREHIPAVAEQPAQ
ncbi:MAG: hypothetical protein ABSE89_12725 [Sedimentisphaerales bacterium]